MPSNLCQRSAIAAAIAACFPAAAVGAGVARVDFASGNVAAISPDGRSRALSKGSEIEVGETVSTQAGRAQLRFSDGAYMSLQPQTEFKIESFKFSGKAEPSDNIVMNLLKGGMRTITGLIGRNNRDAYRLKTDVATIGIRGTEYSVKYTNSIEVFVADGVVSVENQSGSFTVPGGTGVMVSNQQTPPQQTDQKPVLPPESPTQQEQEQQQQQVAEPVNPIQESTPPVSNVVQPPLLTGTLTGNSAANAAGDYETVFGGQIVLDAQGNLVSFASNTFFGGDSLRGTARSELAGNDGVLAWGRWVDGTVGGDGYYSSVDTTGRPLHWVVGPLATNIPTSGEAAYTMIGSIASCNSGCSSVALPVGAGLNGLVVNFGTSAVTWTMTMDIAGGQLAGRYSGSRQEIFGLGSNGGLFVSMPVSGALGSGFASGRGFLAGEGASHAGLTFDASVSDQLRGTASVSGAAAYKK